MGKKDRDTTNGIIQYSFTSSHIYGDPVAAAGKEHSYGLFAPEETEEKLTPTIIRISEKLKTYETHIG